MIKWLLFLTILFYSCKENVPSGVISKEKMQEVLWDVLRAEALSQEIIKKDSSKSSAVESAMLTKKIFSIHHITEEEFKKSYSYYSAHPDIMKEILDSITAKQIRKGSVDTLL